MKKHFYSHIVEIDSIHTALDVLELEEHEKKELIILAETTIHHVVVDTVLTELPPDHKKQFLKYLVEEKHDDIWNLLQAHMIDGENKIRSAAEKLKKELHSDIQEAHKKKKKKK